MLLVGAPAWRSFSGRFRWVPRSWVSRQVPPQGGRNRYFENAYEQGFRRRRVVCPPEALHGHDGPTVEIPCSFTFSTFEVTHSRRIDHGVRHGQNARRPPRRQGESTLAV